MKHYLIYICILVLAFAGACAGEQELYPKEGSSTGTPLMVQASLKEGGADHRPFAANDAIYVYYGYQNLEDIYPWLQGKYTCEKSIITDNWLYDRQSADKSIYKEDIKSPNYNTFYYFTAHSLPAPKESNSDFYAVKLDQTTTGYAASDFLVARAVYSDDRWKTVGITFHFRHVLSRLNIELILPKGSVDDGYFADPFQTSIVSSAVIQDKYTQYKVIYNSEKVDAELLNIVVNEKAGASVHSLQMYKEAKENKDIGSVTTDGGVTAACHKFSCILPIQDMIDKKDKTLLTFTIAGKEYTYSPPEANTINLMQEKITTIRLTVLSQMGNAKLTLNSVTMEDWKTDKANMGDLILVQIK